MKYAPNPTINPLGFNTTLAAPVFVLRQAKRLRRYVVNDKISVYKDGERVGSAKYRVKLYNRIEFDGGGGYINIKSQVGELIPVESLEIGRISMLTS